MFSGLRLRTSALARLRVPAPPTSTLKCRAWPVSARQLTTDSPTSSTSVTKLERLILDNIKATGPIPFANYMQYCLAHPTEGYYMKDSNPVFGTRGDFITSPEISQVFGELLGTWLLYRWIGTVRNATTTWPKFIRVVELGPGRGTLMADILRVIMQFPASADAVREVHLVETSQSMRGIQETKLAELTTKRGCKLIWHDMIEDVPEDSNMFTMLVAHEFFDALPFHLLEKTQEGWQELLVASSAPSKTFATSPPSNLDTLAKSALADAPNSAPTAGPIPTPLSSALNLHATPPTSTSPLDTPAITSSNEGSEALPGDDAAAGPRFRYVLSPKPTAISTLLAQTSPRYAALPVGARAEVSVAANKVARSIARLLSPALPSESGADGREGEEKQTEERVDAGVALIVDYGDAKVFGDSFRAFKEHKIVDVFHRPGECDLTANVDFAYLSEALVEHARPLGLLTQGDFLERMGLSVRVNKLTQGMSQERKEEMESATQRLVDRSGMGTEYKVLGVIGGVNGQPKDIWPFMNPQELK